MARNLVQGYQAGPRLVAGESRYGGAIASAVRKILKSLQKILMKIVENWRFLQNVEKIYELLSNFVKISPICDKY